MMLKENCDLSFMFLTFTFYDEYTLFMKFFLFEEVIETKT